MAVARRRERAGGELHQIGRQLLVRQVQLAAGLQPLEHRARLDDQVVNREVGWGQIDGLPQLGAPGFQPQFRQSLDQIEAPAAELAAVPGLPQPAGRLQQVCASVAPPQALQGRIVEALPSQADPRHAGAQVGLQPGLIEAGRIQLQADLGAGGEAELPVQGRQQCAHLLGCEHRGSAATEVHRAEGRPRRSGGDFPLQQRQVSVDRAAAGVTRSAAGPIPERHHGEVAVEAAPVAEGDVQIGTAGRPGRSRAQGLFGLVAP